MEATVGAESTSATRIVGSATKGHEGFAESLSDEYQRTPNGLDWSPELSS